MLRFLAELGPRAAPPGPSDGPFASSLALESAREPAPPPVKARRVADCICSHISMFWRASSVNGGSENLAGVSLLRFDDAGLVVEHLDFSVFG